METIILNGKYNRDCKIFATDVEAEAYGLIQTILDDKISENVQVRIMPDVHAGKDIVIGFTMPFSNMLNPNHIGVDIGCGVLSCQVEGLDKFSMEAIDNAIRKVIPLGMTHHSKFVMRDIPFAEVQVCANMFVAKFNEKFGTQYSAPTYDEKWLKDKLKAIKIENSVFYGSIGSLGGGNHFIEIGQTSDGKKWLTVHSGSRNFGLKVAKYHTDQAKNQVLYDTSAYEKEMTKIKLETVDRSQISRLLSELKEKYNVGIDKAYLQGEYAMNYIYDMIFAQKYAEWNRKTMIDLISKALNLRIFDEVSSVHNYLDFNDFIIRKGAISSYLGKKMVIPFNMRDGILLCEGKSNGDWNCSAPHGAGRLMSRSKAKAMLNMDEFTNTMKSVYSTSVCKDTLDESPMAYKDSELIEMLIEDTATIIDKIIPILNVKATE
jgi:tRNA-splicing ligase RtcB (3'-phosphate/5'-hydroxy nucleic acid ligase)